MSFKKTKVVMLPTNEKANLKLGQNGLLVNNTLGYDAHFTNQHLYFLSDDEIKEGDWVIHGLVDDYIYQVNKYNIKQSLANKSKKIIATTDKSLDFKNTEDFPSFIGIHKRDIFPEPSKSFIEKYVREHYSGVPIKNVLVEYNHLVSTNGTETETKEWLKVASDNTITIRKIKDSWTTEEVVNLLQQFNNDKPGIFDCGKWMEENINL